MKTNENSKTKFKYGAEVEDLYTKSTDECIKAWIKTGENQVIIVYSGIKGYKFGTGVWASVINKDETIQDVIEFKLKKQDDLSIDDIIHIAYLENGTIYLDGQPSLKVKKLGSNYRVTEIDKGNNA